MFKEFVEKKHYAFCDGFEDWREAVRAACQPLIADKTIENEYIDAIIGKIEEYGPYIVIAPNIAIPHAQEGVGVNDTAVSFMKTEKPVHFDDDPEHDARLFFVLASTNNEIHLQNLSEMAEILDDEEFVAKILECHTAEDLLALEP